MRYLSTSPIRDGRNNSGPLPAESRARAPLLGITINGLPILVDTYGLDRYFEDKVIAGPGAFIEVATDYQDFARAFLRKLRRELTPFISRRERLPGKSVRVGRVDRKDGAERPD